MPAILRRLLRFLGLAGSRPVRDPRQVFEHFRRVLRSNGRAMEIIADLGEKLGGNYIFDSRYIDDRFDDLVAAVRASVDALNRLDGRHQDLYPVFERLTTHLRNLMRGEDDRHGPAVMPLREVSFRHHGIVGGKNAHLAEIIAHLDMAVPDGFVITTSAYHDLVDHNGLRPLVERFEAIWPGGAGLEDLRRRIAAGLAGAEPGPGLMEEIARHLRDLAGTAGPGTSLAVRSSSREEDLDFSFAGQFVSRLNVTPDPGEVFAAYREVAASLFSRRAIDYRRWLFPGDGRMSIAAGCQVMVDSRVSGVAYSTDPGDPGGDRMVVVAAWGQGAGIVEGACPGDTFVLRKGEPPRLESVQVSRKERALFPARGGGLEERELDGRLRENACLDESRAVEIGRLVLRLENFFKRPQDMEWAIDGQGRVHVLQSRPLLVPATRNLRRKLADALDRHDVLVSGRGQVAQQGIGAGPVRVVRREADLDGFPEGAVLVARRDSSRFARIMHRAAAIVTEAGTPVSHMATLCRERRVPALVNVHGILDLVEEGREITVDADDRRIFRGRVRELLAYQVSTSASIEATGEFRLLRRLLDSVTRLSLVDPLMDEFVPENCQTYHDLLRYVHESAVLTLVDMGRDERDLLRDDTARHLDLPVPAGIMVVDLGGGLAPDAPAGHVTMEHVASIPFRAILAGMLHPGVWHRAAMPVGFHDLMNSMLSVPADTLGGQYSGHNIAVLSRDYVNLCFRFGYHYNLIDARCGGHDHDNHIYFRFLGGATDMTKRSRRARMIAAILGTLDFNIRVRDDLVIARTGNMPAAEMERVLDVLGRLVGFTRQLDVRLDTEAAVDYYARAFLRGDYGVVGPDGPAG